MRYEHKMELRQGPAHTRGDIIVHVPEDRTVFKILFSQMAVIAGY